MRAAWYGTFCAPAVQYRSYHAYCQCITTVLYACTGCIVHCTVVFVHPLVVLYCSYHAGTPIQHCPGPRIQPLWCTTLKWFSPFGNQYLGDMVSTEKFSALKVLKDGALRKQKDEYNCGIGLVAAIGIILRNFLGRSTVSEITRYNKMFDHSSMHVKKSSTEEEVEESPEEYLCCFQRMTFKSLPTTGGQGLRTYLHELKAQWFTLFDCYAELQHDILRKCRDHNYFVDPAYIGLKGQLEDYEWPKHPQSAGDEKKGTASEQGADQCAVQVACLGANADGGADQVVKLWCSS